MKLNLLYGYMHKRKTIFLDLLIILSLSFIPFTRIMGISGRIMRSDFFFPINLVDRFLSHLYLWNPQIGLGHSFKSLSAVFPYYFVTAILNYLGLRVELLQKALCVFTFFLLGTSMYYLVSTLVIGEKRRVTSLIATLFYMFNPFVLFYLLNAEIIALLVRAILPFMFALYTKGLNDKLHFKKYAILTGLISMGIPSANPATTAAIIFPLVLYFFYCISTMKEKKYILKFSAFTVLFSLSLNIWWLLPMSYNISDPNIFGNILSRSPDVLNFVSQRSILTTVIRLVGYNIRQSTFPHIYSYTSSGIVILAGFALVILSYSALLFKPKSKYVLFFSILGIICILFGMGNRPPFGIIYMWIWNNFQPFQIMRNPYKFVGVLSFAYAFLIGIASSELYYKLKLKFPNNIRRKRLFSKIFVVMVIFLIFASSLPLSIGNYYGWLTPVHVPSYYDDAKSYLSQDDGTYRIFLLPNRYWTLKYTWSPYACRDVLPEFLSKPVILYSVNTRGETFPTSLSLIKFSYSSIHGNKTSLTKILGIMNVKYFIINNDLELNHPFARIKDPASYRKIFNSQKGIQLGRTFGRLTFYRNDYWQPLHIYVTK